jgi:protein-tyrosine phosphatase
MPRVAGFEMPDELYCVQREPAPLFGMGYPRGRKRQDWSALFEAGVRGVVCLASERVFYEPAPVVVLGSFALEDLVHGGAPAEPERELEMIRQATKLVVARLEAGEGVVVHCIGGRGRTGTVIGSVLVALGHAAEDVVSYLDHVHAVRRSAGWPESPWQAEVVRGVR